jgi:ribosome biogenesis protein ERB1
MFIQIFKGHTGAVTTMSTDTVGKILYTGSSDATIRSFNITTGQCIRVSKKYLFK